jgi:hypothetical protein
MLYLACYLLLRTAGRTVPIAATRIYQMSFFTGFGVSALIYWILSAAFPPLGTPQTTFLEIDVSDDRAAADDYYEPSSDKVQPPHDLKKDDYAVETHRVL